MKYTKEERMTIGRQIHDGKMTKAKAAAMYGISIYTARDYLRVYKAYVRLREKGEAPEANTGRKPDENGRLKAVVSKARGYEEMTRQQLINEIERLKEAVARKREME